MLVHLLDLYLCRMRLRPYDYATEPLRASFRVAGSHLCCDPLESLATRGNSFYLGRDEVS